MILDFLEGIDSVCSFIFIFTLHSQKILGARKILFGRICFCFFSSFYCWLLLFLVSFLFLFAFLFCLLLYTSLYHSTSLLRFLKRWGVSAKLVLSLFSCFMLFAFFLSSYCMKISVLLSQITACLLVCEYSIAI